MVQVRWIRRLVRRHMNPVDESSAKKWTTRFSVAYMLIAWNTIGLVAYACYQGKTNLADYYGLMTDEEKMMANNEYFARSLGRSANTRLMTVRGLTVTEDRELDQKKPEEELDPSQFGEGTYGETQARIAARRRLIDQEVARQLKEREDAKHS